MQVDERRKELSKYRDEKAKENLKASKLLLENELYLESINRSYYGMA
ncbi:hypothetical protein [Haliovirga abyssi]|uniref:Transposase n=1 Tax=Haliovirga abyssi TaxID=2996794 RepID=A0AAU9DF98_9FUSO|nr:hypothetical protein [Haliovirga abyssi]BDU50873.1 hypothetical protein HLVA_14420 [Haliovirga abyssi]